MLTALAMASILASSEAPPGLANRSIAPRPELPGIRTELQVEGAKWVLFVPDSWVPGPETNLAVHFHSAEWHAIQEHLDRGLADPLLAFYPGEGSAIYARSVADPEHFPKLMEAVRTELVRRRFPTDGRIDRIDVTSFSAGYGAVREWVKQPEPFHKLRRVILADSLYGSLDPAATVRVPLEDHIEVWEPLARAAIEGRKEFLITVSDVATPTYASSRECAEALVARVGGTMSEASGSGEFPLRSTFAAGRFMVWRYGGDDARAHMAHARHLATFWRALDRR